MKLGVFDIGTNSIHLLIVEIQRDLSFKVLSREKDTTRLGDGSFKNKTLSESSVRRGLRVIARFHRTAKKSNVKKFIAVATSAVREAKNGGKFVDAIKKRTGIRVCVITGEEEARLIYLAARSNIPLGHQRALVVDIGGGSVELIVGDHRRIYLLESLKLGVARLTDRFITKDPPSKKNLRNLTSHLERKLKPLSRKIRKMKVSAVIGTAGTFMSLAAMIHESVHTTPLRSANRFKIRHKDLDAVAARIIRSHWRERLKIPGLDPKRIDIVVAGVVLVRTLMRMLKIQSVVLSKSGIREGIVLDYIGRHRRGSLTDSLDKTCFRVVESPDRPYRRE